MKKTPPAVGKSNQKQTENLPSRPVSIEKHPDPPRERLEKCGAKHLSIRELLCLLVGTGTKHQTVYQVVDTLLSNPFWKDDLKAQKISYLTKLSGLGTSKAARIIAAVELGKRLHEPPCPVLRSLHHSKRVYEYIRPHLSNLTHEVFWVLGVDHSHHPLFLETMGTGSKTQVHFMIREVFSILLRSEATGFFCIHNHPSGNPMPSVEDEHITMKLLQGSHVVGIHFIDHIIATSSQYFSFADQHDLFSSRKMNL
ncbi:MAG: DNA repair protein RadC [Bdellovibrionota bacterium]